jgi:uncharacterized membrane protein (DUF4010 family)
MQVVISFLVAIFLGALIGLQREYEQQHSHIFRFAGIRTFILISILGALLGYLSKEVLGNYVLAMIGLVIVLVFAALSYILTYMKYKDNTATTEIASVLVYVIALMCTIGFMELGVFLGILIAVFLTFKKRIHHFPEKIKKKELVSLVEFALISLVILPVLPNKNYAPTDSKTLTSILTSLGISHNLLSQLDVFNLYHVWLMVILVAGIGFLGYILVKFFGTKRGYGLAGFVGGLISSTAVTLSMSEESKKYKKLVNPFVIAVVVASSTSFFRVLLEVSVVNRSLLNGLLFPLLLMGILGYGATFFLYLRKGKKKNKKSIKLEQPFALMPAIKFGAFFLFIIFLSKLLQVLVGSSGLYLASALSGFADVDAITLTMASLSKMGQISNKVATISIILAASSNILTNGGLAWFFGEKKFAYYVLGIFALILIFGLGSLMFI